MGARVEYFDGCAAAHALDIVGERWALLVVRELALGPKRFTDLRAGLPKASPNVLSQRLRELERYRVLRRRTLPAPAASAVYELTEWGHELRPVLQALARWGVRSPWLPEIRHMGADTALLAMRTMFDPTAAGGAAASYELHLGGQPFRAELANGEFVVERGTAPAPDVVVTGDSTALAGVVFGGVPLADALRGGALTVEGDHAAFAHLITLFPLPEPAAVAP